MESHVDMEMLLLLMKTMVEPSSTVHECHPNVPGNPVGKLVELCIKSKRPPPEFEQVGEEGRPHEKVYVTACKLGSQIREEGTGSSKNHAKKAAANKVIQRLVKMMTQVRMEGIALQNQVDGNVVEKLQSLVNKKQVKQESSTVLNLLAELKERSGDKLLSLQGLQEKGIYFGTDCTKLLREVAEEQKFQVAYVDMDNDYDEEDFHCVVSIGTAPFAIFVGRGESMLRARKDAAERAIDFLRIATRK